MFWIFLRRPLMRTTSPTPPFTTAEQLRRENSNETCRNLRTEKMWRYKLSNYKLKELIFASGSPHAYQPRCQRTQSHWGLPCPPGKRTHTTLSLSELHLTDRATSQPCSRASGHWTCPQDRSEEGYMCPQVKLKVDYFFCKLEFSSPDFWWSKL